MPSHWPTMHACCIAVPFLWGEYALPFHLDLDSTKVLANSRIREIKNYSLAT